MLLGNQAASYPTLPVPRMMGKPDCTEIDASALLLQRHRLKGAGQPDVACGVQRKTPEENLQRREPFLRGECPSKSRSSKIVTGQAGADVQTRLAQEDPCDLKLQCWF